MKSCFVIIAIMVAFNILGTYSQLGIKTHRPSPTSENLTYVPLVRNLDETHRNLFYWNGTYYSDQKALFLNRTLSEVPPGICFKEVPTASLVKNTDEIPAGNGSDPSLSRIQVCCDGYERNVHNFRKCDPICKKECVNGICIAPDTCVCFPDHVLNIGQFCMPTCPIGCENGECQPDGSCACKPGFVLEPKTRKFCMPHCRQGCQYGNCTAPDTCTCSEGYQETPDGKCEPKCDNCENGECTAPGLCKCKQGYVRKENKCEPVCVKGCHNGVCKAPDVCSCNPGFTIDPTGTNCIPHCDIPCLNGYCSGGNTCTCNTGYTLDEFNPSLCVPLCPGGCPNGYCTAPNFCICKPGFIKAGVKGKQNCVPV